MARKKTYKPLTAAQRRTISRLLLQARGYKRQQAAKGK
jgi:hypothetical protein